MEHKPFVLIVDDEWRLAQNLTRFMQRRGFEAQAVTSVTAANAVIIMSLCISDLLKSSMSTRLTRLHKSGSAAFCEAGAGNPAGSATGWPGRDAVFPETIPCGRRFRS